MSDSPELIRMMNDQALARGRAERDVRERAFLAAVALAQVDVPYARPGYGPGMLLTASQWENFDAMNAIWDRTEAKYGRMFPKAFATMRNMGRTVWCRQVVAELEESRRVR